MALNHTLRTLFLTGAIGLGLVADGNAQGRPPMRQHTATDATGLKLIAATVRLGGGVVEAETVGNTLQITSNGIPTHKVGRFPNGGNPNRIAGVSHRFKVPGTPKPGSATTVGLRMFVGVAVNGVPFDPGAAEFWMGNPRSGWQYEALGGAVPLGLDANFAHVQPDGRYHYHGLPIGLMAELGWSADVPSPLIGYAADGFPIYAVAVGSGGTVKPMRSSWQLKSGPRPGGAAPGGRHDGAFVQDYQYVAGSGDLDECNGALVRTAEYPQGTYAYVLTETFPVIPRCLRGQADRSFSKR